MKHVRFLKDFHFWPRPSIKMENYKGEEKKVTEALFEAANAAGAVELINGESAEQGEAAPETGGNPAEGSAVSRTGNRTRRG